MLREVWRVLADSGRLMGHCAKPPGFMGTSLTQPQCGHGRPYSRGQLSQLLKENMFMPERDISGLVCAPD